MSRIPTKKHASNSQQLKKVLLLTVFVLAGIIFFAKLFADATTLHTALSTETFFGVVIGAGISYALLALRQKQHDELSISREANPSVNAEGAENANKADNAEDSDTAADAVRAQDSALQHIEPQREEKTVTTHNLVGAYATAATSPSDQPTHTTAGKLTDSIPGAPVTSQTDKTLVNSEAPLTPENDGEPSFRSSQLDFSTFAEKLLDSPDPLAELKLIAAEINLREKFFGAPSLKEAPLDSFVADPVEHTVEQTESPSEQKEDAGIDEHTEEPLRPSGAELFLAHRLYESGIFDEKIVLPHVHIVRPRASQMFYLRVEQGQLPYPALLVILRVEAALNALRFAYNYYDNPQDVSEEDIVVLQQRISASITAQAAPIDTPIDFADKSEADGEWAVRHFISTAIESLQLPYRLNVSWRTNVADGNVAMEIQMTPADVFPHMWVVPGLAEDTKRVKATRMMRRQMASAYVIRLALLLAAHAFRASSKIKHVWVAAVADDATRHRCYLSVDFDRWRFAKTDLNHTDDLEKIMQPFCPVMRLEEGFLRPVTQHFSLSQGRFCPPRRFESVSLSARKLPGQLASALGTDHVSGLAINESEKRELIADDILRHLIGPAQKNATQHNVRAILDLAGDDPDPSVRSAAERTANALVRGAIVAEPQAVVEEFVAGDVLSRACAQARSALQKKNPAAALSVLNAALEPLETAGAYSDSSQVAWRYFSNFVDRALFNRRHSTTGQSLMLIPDTYYQAHALAAAAELAEGHPKRAKVHAEELVRIAPVDTHAKLQLVRCYEALGDDESAVEWLSKLLDEAHDPQSIGTAYYRMAFFQWKRGNILAARACYQQAIHFVPAAMQTIAMELATLELQTGSKDVREPLEPQELQTILKTHHIPDAPNDDVAEVFLECAQASLDAEIFPVARNFLSTMAAFNSDDIIVGMMNSLESFPGSL